MCPRCHSSLEGVTRSVCSGCGTTYESAAGVPVLVAGGISAQQAAQREYFDAEFSALERYELPNWRLSFLERIVNALGVLEGGGPYLDVGVGGSGATVIEVARHGVDAVGCDLSVAGVVQAQRFAAAEGVDDRAAFVACAAEALPFADGAFGSASAVAVLEHLDDDAAAAAELARVVRRGGLVWITVPNAYRYIPPPLWPVYLAHDRRLGHKRHYDERRLLRLAAGAGLEHVRTESSAPPVKVLQLAVERIRPAVRRPRSPIWWRLEARDRRRPGRALGALQLNAVFRRT